MVRVTPYSCPFTAAECGTWISFACSALLVKQKKMLIFYKVFTS
jgi:hypothetical protein